jgi:hypothetical protein
MSNTIGFDYKTTDYDLNMSNGSMSMFINILCLSGGRLATTDSQRRLMVFLAEKNQSAVGLGTVGFDIVDMPWDKKSFEDDKAFMLKVADGAKNRLGWETLGYQPNEEFVEVYTAKFTKLIDHMTINDVNEDAIKEWLEGADETDPVNLGYPKCTIHDTYLSCFGCQICTD